MTSDDGRALRADRRGRARVEELLDALTASGFVVTSPCKEGPGGVWLRFYSAQDVKRFLDRVGRGALYEAVAGNGYGEADWRYSVAVDDGRLGDDGEAAGPPDFVLRVSVWFPRADLPRVLGRVRAGKGRR